MTGIRSSILSTRSYKTFSWSSRVFSGSLNAVCRASTFLLRATIILANITIATIVAMARSVSSDTIIVMCLSVLCPRRLAAYHPLWAFLASSTVESPCYTLAHAPLDETAYLCGTFCPRLFSLEKVLSLIVNSLSHHKTSSNFF